MKLTLPTDSAARKGVPLYSGCYSYFPAALAGVAIHSKEGNDKHSPGEPLHHSRGKAGDHADCIARHSMDIADMLARKVVFTAEDKKALLTESRALSWRALAWAQEIEELFGAPLAPGARLPDAVLYTEKVAAYWGDSALSAPPPADADGLAKALHRTERAGASAPSQRDGSQKQWHPAGQVAYGYGQLPPEKLSSPPKR